MAHHSKGGGEGGERGWKEWLTVVARTKRKYRRIQREQDINITTLQPRGNTAVARRFVSVFIHIRGCYVNLQYNLTVVTSSYTCGVSFERNNEIFNTRELHITDL